MINKAFDFLKSLVTDVPDDFNSFKVFIEHEFAKKPEKAHASDAGWDLFSCEHVVIPPKQWAAVDTGIRFVIPSGWEIQIRAKSGLALKKGIAVLNGPGPKETKVDSVQLASNM